VTRKKKVGLVIPKINRREFSVLADDWVWKNNKETILGRMIKVPLKQGDRETILLGVVLNFESLNEVTSYSFVVQNIANSIQKEEDSPQLMRMINKENHLVLFCEVVSAFTKKKDKWYRSRSDLPIPPLTPCEWFTEEDLKEVVGDRNFFYLGRSFGSDVLAPLHLEDFSQQNEAYHFLVAGMAGSGKSTLVKMLLAGYGRNRTMNFLILDTAGEFARVFRDQDESGFPLKMATLWRNMGRSEPRVIGIDEMALSTWDALEELLKKRKVLEGLGVKVAENARRGIEHLVAELRRQDVELNKLLESEEKVLEVLRSPAFLNTTYSDKKRQDSLLQATYDAASMNRFWSVFRTVAERFAEGSRPSAYSVAWRILDNPGTTVVLDLSTLEWDDPFKYVFIQDVVGTLTYTAMQAYRKKGGAAFNTLVVVEEAHRLVPPKGWIESGETEREKTKRTILRALTETRKAGLGWMLISTRISNLDRAVYEEARVRIIGRGLSSGEDADRIRESYGSKVLEHYKSLPDPADPMGEDRSHIFMLSGPICVLSRDNPEFVEVFTSDTEFLQNNKLFSDDEHQSDFLDEYPDEYPDEFPYDLPF